MVSLVWPTAEGRGSTVIVPRLSKYGYVPRACGWRRGFSCLLAQLWLVVKCIHNLVAENKLPVFKNCGEELNHDRTTAITEERCALPRAAVACVGRGWKWWVRKHPPYRTWCSFCGVGTCCADCRGEYGKGRGLLFVGKLEGCGRDRCC